MESLAQKDNYLLIFLMPCLGMEIKQVAIDSEVFAEHQSRRTEHSGAVRG